MEGRRLDCTVWSEQPEQLALIYREDDSVNSGEIPESLCEIIYLDYCQQFLAAEIRTSLECLHSMNSQKIV